MPTPLQRPSRLALLMIEDRNLTVHTYEEQLANEIAARVPSHARLLMAWIDAVALRNS